MKRIQFSGLFSSPFGRSLAGTLLILTLGPMLALIALGTYTIRVQLQERSIAQISTVADLIQQNTSQWVSTTSDDLNTFLANPVVAQNATFVLRTADAGRAKDVLQKEMDTLRDSHAFSSVYLVTPDGNVALPDTLASSGATLGVDIKQLETSGQHYWGFDKFPLSGRISALTWQPIFDQRREILGFLVGEFDLENLTSILNQNSVGLGRTGQAYLVDENFVPLTPVRAADGKLTNNLQTKPLTVDSAVATALRSPGGKYNGSFTDYSGTQVLGTVQILQTPLHAWLAVDQSEAEAFDVLFTLARAVALFGIVLGVIALLASFFTTQRIIRPVATLAQAAHAMARGDLQTRVDIPRRDEFGLLATSFNAMADELGGLFGDLEMSNSQLRNRAEQLNTITRVGQHATSVLNLDDVLETITQEIQKAFNYYSVAMYLPVEGADPENPIVAPRAAAGASSTDFLARGRHHAAAGMVGKAVTDRAMVTVQDVQELADYQKDETQPFTRSEVSIPLLVDAGQRLIGVLDIQSDRPGAFGKEDLEVLQILANQIAIAIRNAELFRETDAARKAADEANHHKSEFLSNMSHELRTPLNVIIGYSHSMLNRPAMYNNEPLPQIYGSAIQSIMTSGQHLLGLINDILDLSKIEAGRIDLEMKSTDPLPILQGVRQTALGLVKKGVEVRVDYPNEMPYVMADELRLRQVLLNLVSNASKFTEQGTITIGAQLYNESILFSVTDTGVGIPQDAQAKLFERFKQAGADVTRKYGGTGLGLSISKQLVEMHGGEIWFKSKAGKGTTFFFTIPLLKLEEAGKFNPIKPASEGDHIVAISPRASMFTTTDGDNVTLRQQVVLVDSQLETRNELQNRLAEAGYDVLPVEGAEEALALASALLPDAIIIHLHAEDEPDVAELGNLVRADESLTATTIVELREAAASGNSKIDWSVAATQQVQDMLKNAANPPSLTRTA